MEEFMDATPSVEETNETTETESMEVSQDTQTDDATTEETQAETKPFSFELQYNKEKVVIDNEDKLRELAQKGMNYDKIHERTNELQKQIQEQQNNPLLNWASKQMQSYGFTDPQDFLNALEVQNKTNELMENYGFTEEQAKRIAEAESKAAKVEQKFSDLEKKERENKEYSEFLEWYDDKHKKGIFKDQLDAGQIPTQVWDAVNKGMPLKTAYMEYALDNLKVNTEQEVLKNIQKNAQTTPGSVKENTQQEDANWTTEYIEAMADKYGQSWVIKNFDKIEKSGYYK